MQPAQRGSRARCSNHTFHPELQRSSSTLSLCRFTATLTMQSPVICNCNLSSCRSVELLVETKALVVQCTYSLLLESHSSLFILFQFKFCFCEFPIVCPFESAGRADELNWNKIWCFLSNAASAAWSTYNRAN